MRITFQDMPSLPSVFPPPDDAKTSSIIRIFAHPGRTNSDPIQTPPSPSPQTSIIYSPFHPPFYIWRSSCRALATSASSSSSPLPVFAALKSDRHQVQGCNDLSLALNEAAQGSFQKISSKNEQIILIIAEKEASLEIWPPQNA